MSSVEVVAPTLATDYSGNSISARRYAQTFGDLGFRASVVAEPSGDGDIVVALNAFRTASAIESAAEQGTPVVVVLTGTDIYRFMTTDREIVVASLDRADRLVGLNDRIGEELECRHRARLDVIREGAARASVARSTRSGEFAVAVVGHLRDEKDPATTAGAVRDLPPGSRVVVHHYGSAYTKEWSDWARREGHSNGRYRWHGELPHEAMGSIYAHSHVLVNSSVMEGGANAISEAVMTGLPVVASDIPGNIGVLGEAYAGYFPVGDADTLRLALLSLEREPQRLAALAAAVSHLQPRFELHLERTKWAALFANLGL